MKGILLAGGSGTRLAPLTDVLSKQLLPVYDKPVIYYPLATLMLAGIRDVMIISTARDIPMIENLLGSGENLGMKFLYRVQEKPAGIAQAFHIAESDFGNSPVCLILGDNIFYGHDLPKKLSEARQIKSGARVFACKVNDPERYGVVDFDIDGFAKSIEEKPKAPKSNWAVTGLYFYDADVFKLAKKIAPSARGELEITDVNRLYLEQKRLTVEPLGRGFAWLDAGTFDSLMDASSFVQTIESRQATKVCCPEEIALLQGFIDEKTFEKHVERYNKNSYGSYLKQVLAHHRESKI